VWLNKQCPVDTKDGVLTQRSAVDQPDSAFRPAQQKHKGAADERAVVDRVLLTSNDDAQVTLWSPAWRAFQPVMPPPELAHNHDRQAIVSSARKITCAGCIARCSLGKDTCHSVVRIRAKVKG